MRAPPGTPPAASPVGQGVPAPAGQAIVTGAARFTCDLAPDEHAPRPDDALPPEPPLHLKLVRAPHAHARIRSVDASRALRVPGVVAVLSYADSPATLFSTARHANPDDDPYDTLVFDRTVRFHGQRVAAVVAETVAAAEAGCALVDVDYEVLPAVTSPAAALAPGAPLLHPDLAPGNVCAEVHRSSGDPGAGLAAADVVYQETFLTQRVQHVALETHATIGWLDPGGAAGQARLVLRTSTQVPFLTRDELCRVFGLERDRVRVIAERVGGGFGGKQEMLTEDVVALAVLRTGRPVQLEFTREEEFAAATTRHPMAVTVQAGATSDGTLTGLALDVTADTGAYGNHGPGVHVPRGRGSGHRLPLPQQARRRPRRLHQHGPGGGVPRLRALADGVRRRVRDRRARAACAPRPGRVPPPQPDPPGRTRRTTRAASRADVSTASLGVRECLDLVEKALASGRGDWHGRARGLADRDGARGRAA